MRAATLVAGNLENEPAADRRRRHGANGGRRGGGFSRLYRLSSGNAWLCQNTWQNRKPILRSANLQRESAETRLQINQVRRETLRSDKFNRKQQLKTLANDPTRGLLQQRLDEIDDALRDVNAERERLKNFSVP